MSKRIKEKTTSGAGSWPVAYRWLAGGTLAVYTALGCHRVAYAQQSGTPAEVSVQVRRFDISAGPLETVLAEYRLAAGIDVTLADEKSAMCSRPA